MSAEDGQNMIGDSQEEVAVLDERGDSEAQPATEENVAPQAIAGGEPARPEQAIEREADWAPEAIEPEIAAPATPE
jgi:hypothetical protein